MLDLLRDIQRKSRHRRSCWSRTIWAWWPASADRVAVMYAGKIVEIGTAEEIFYDPRHPYTWGLLQAPFPLRPWKTAAAQGDSGYAADAP